MDNDLEMHMLRFKKFLYFLNESDEDFKITPNDVDSFLWILAYLEEAVKNEQTAIQLDQIIL